MVRPLLCFVAAALAGCTVPAYQCGHAVPCARGSVQSCTSRDGARCHYLLGDGTVVECASCEDCFAAERELASWCAGDEIGANDGGAGSVASDLATTTSSGADLGAAPASDLGARPSDLAVSVDDLGWGSIDTDLGCYGFGINCNDDPTCCAQCCSGGCTQFGYCALQ